MKKNLQSPNLIVSVLLPLCLLFSACNKTESDRPTAAMPDADNTAKNERDRNDTTLTPGDQGKSPADRAVTQNIRKAIVSDSNGYSATAKNIKIITINGKTTLRGPVKSDAEKTGIVTLAKTIAGEGNVDDQLEVKANP